jgi:hypothetical protein
MTKYLFAIAAALWILTAKSWQRAVAKRHHVMWLRHYAVPKLTGWPRR